MVNKLDLVKQIIRGNRKEANCGIFFTPNIAGDVVNTLYKDDEIDIEICREYGYFEVFGLSPAEQVEVEQYYKSMITVEDAAERLERAKALFEDTAFGYEAKSAFDIAIKSLQAWDKVTEEIKELKEQEFQRADRSDCALAECYAYQTVQDIIKKHLGEII